MAVFPGLSFLKPLQRDILGGEIYASILMALAKRKFVAKDHVELYLTPCFPNLFSLGFGGRNYRLKIL